jgi:hypothetical protein
MEKKKERMMMMMTLCLSDLEEWKKLSGKKHELNPAKTKEKKRNSIDALEAALCNYQISERKKCGELGVRILSQNTQSQSQSQQRARTEESMQSASWALPWPTVSPGPPRGCVSEGNRASDGPPVLSPVCHRPQ